VKPLRSLADCQDRQDPGAGVGTAGQWHAWSHFILAAERSLTQRRNSRWAWWYQTMCSVPPTWDPRSSNMAMGQS